MKSLNVIQGVFKVLKTVIKVLQVLCIVGAVSCGLGGLMAITKSGGGEIFFIFGEPIEIFPEGTDLVQVFADLTATTCLLIAEAILLLFSYKYVCSELEDGTPFTERGAEQLKKLGIQFIWIPVVAVVIAQILASIKGATAKVDNLESIITGLVLILASLIFRYGAELENKLSTTSCQNAEESANASMVINSSDNSNDNTFAE